MVNDTGSIDTVVDAWKGEVLSGVCETCPSYCCSYNLTDLSLEQIELLFGEKWEWKRSKNGEPSVIDNGNGTYKTNYHKGDHCPQLVEGKCAIYNHPNKPQICSDFPLYVDEKKGVIFVSPNLGCPGTNSLPVALLAKPALEQGYTVKCNGNRSLSLKEVELTIEGALLI